jgi:glutaredoxin-like protein
VINNKDEKRKEYNCRAGEADFSARNGPGRINERMVMGLLKESDQDHLKHEFAKLDHEVKLSCFSQSFECMFCERTRTLSEEVAQLSDKVSLDLYDFQKDVEKVAQYNIDKIPAVILEGSKDYGVRYFGVPAGYEFSALIESIVNVSRGRTNLSENTKSRLQSLTRPIHIQVFITPT